MTNQPEHENQQPETVTPEEVRQAILAELEATRQAITELSDEEIETITGAGPAQSRFGLESLQRAQQGARLTRSQSAPGRLENTQFDNSRPAEPPTESMRTFIQDVWRVMRNPR